MGRKLLEAVADIAFIAGTRRYFSGNSRADVDDFIYWAEEFEKQNKKTDWLIEDYIEEIEKFARKKISEERKKDNTMKSRKANL